MKRKTIPYSWSVNKMIGAKFSKKRGRDIFVNRAVMPRIEEDKFLVVYGCFPLFFENVCTIWYYIGFIHYSSKWLELTDFPRRHRSSLRSLEATATNLFRNLIGFNRFAYSQFWQNLESVDEAQIWARKHPQARNDLPNVTTYSVKMKGWGKRTMIVQKIFNRPRSFTATRNYDNTV